MKIAIGNDHSAVELKNIIVDFLKEKGIEVLNLVQTAARAVIIQFMERR